MFAARFGVPVGQVRRDHLISHVLNALPRLGTPVFFGGTALCRTHLPDWRLSEDLDLLVEDPTRWRSAWEHELPRLIRREYPSADVQWHTAGPTTTGWLRTDGGLDVRLQLVAADDSYRRYPTAPTAVALRYPDLDEEVTLLTPTVAAAAAMKLNAWSARRAPRDLVDLYGLVENDAIQADAIEIATAASRAPQPRDFTEARLPSADQWTVALAGQMAQVPDRLLALRRVRAAVAKATDWP